MLRIQQKSKLSFILLLECTLKVFSLCHHHQRCISPIEPHIKHSLNVHSAPFESLPLQLCADVNFEFVQSGKERGEICRCVERR